MQSQIADLGIKNPGAFGLKEGDDIRSAFASGTISVGKNGLHVFVDFLLDGEIKASDGTPVKYKVGWDLLDVVQRGY
jgi:hypothetical protein